MSIKDSKGGKNHKNFNFLKYISCKKIKVKKNLKELSKELGEQMKCEKL
jgi:hypothetical protein